MWLIYGANGYTGALIAAEAVPRGPRPTPPGRDAAEREALARELGCDVRAFGLDDIDLAGVDLVLHCAGPFTITSAPMVDACLRAGAHYVDITGEIPVFEAILSRDAEAKARGVTLLPGAGFDVVPTDCLAAMLAERLPDATELLLAFYPKGSALSRGTTRTMIESIGDAGAIRRDSRIVRVPPAYDVRTIPFSCGERTAMTIPWGDVATAFHTPASESGSPAALCPKMAVPPMAAVLTTSAQPFTSFAAVPSVRMVREPPAVMVPLNSVCR